MPHQSFVARVKSPSAQTFLQRVSASRVLPSLIFRRGVSNVQWIGHQPLNFLEPARTPAKIASPRIGKNVRLQTSMEITENLSDASTVYIFDTIDVDGEPEATFK
jgi:hypothetical protein